MTVAATSSDARVRMERMYRPQKLIYDLTRKYYLIGRDLLVDGLDARPCQRLVDIGCGTGRNLDLVARRYPGVQLFGIDAAEAMLELSRDRLGRRVELRRALAEELDARGLFALDDGFDHAVFSYALSMMDDPVAAIERALDQLVPGGRLHVVDFGDMEGLSAPARQLMRAWLARFGVHHRPAVRATLASLADRGCGRLETRHLLGGYALLLRFTKPA